MAREPQVKRNAHSKWRRRWLALPLWLLLSALLESAWAGCPAPDPGVDVAVGIRQAPPFVVDDPIRGQRGFSIELWRSIEAELSEKGLIGETQLIECSLADQLVALEEGRLDLVISPLTITAERMARFDFTQQYLGSGITVAHRRVRIIDFGHATQVLRETLAQPGVLRVIVLFLLLNLLIAALVSRSLKYHVDFEIIGRETRPVRWTRAGLETLSRTTGLLGMSNEFRTTLTKMLDAFMAIIGTLLSATIFGVLTAALIGSIGNRDDISLGEVSNLRVATLESSTSQVFLESLHEFSDNPGTVQAPEGASHGPMAGRRLRAGPLPAQGGDPLNTDGLVMESPTCLPLEAASPEALCVTASSWGEAMTYLARGDVEAVVGDWAQLSFLARRGGFGDDVQVQSSAFRNEPYGWGINPQRPELREAVDRALMERLRHPQWRYLVQEYLGSGSIGTN